MRVSLITEYKWVPVRSVDDNNWQWYGTMTKNVLNAFDVIKLGFYWKETIDLKKASDKKDTCSWEVYSIQYRDSIL